jgi:hypothetical protein
MIPSTTTKMTAPPSTAYKIVDVPEAYADVIQRQGIAGRFVGRSEPESPWVPFGPKAAIRHVLFDTGQNIFSNLLCSQRLMPGGGSSITTKATALNPAFRLTESFTSEHPD